MKLLYWNLKSNPNLESIIKDCIIENEVDIALFSEFEMTDFNKLNLLLQHKYNLLASCGGCDRVKIIFNKHIQLTSLLKHQRYLITKLHYSNKDYLLVGVHLPSNTNGNKSSERKHIIRKIINDLADNENNTITSCIVIGDMNASPFDSEMVEKDAFNAVLFKNIIKQHEVVRFQKDNYKRFYNPIIEYITELNENYGSFYYGSGNGCLYWYCFDQILVRKNLSDNIKSLSYLKEINHKSLLNKSKPNRLISDHLPLIVDITI